VKPLRNVPPGPRGHLLLGCFPEYSRDPLGFLTRCAKEYGDAVRFRLGGLSFSQFNHPDQIEEVLRTKHHLFIKDRPLQISTSVFGKGLLSSEGELWRRQRRLMQPAFLQQQTRGHAGVMAASAAGMLASWRVGQVRDVYEDLTRLTLDIAARSLFGADLTDEADEIAAAIAVMSDHFLRPFYWTRPGKWLPLPVNLRFWAAVRRLDRVIHEIIRRGRERDHDAGDVLSRLLAAQRVDGSPMPDRQLRDEMVTLLLAGHETTALALSYCFYLLARHPEVERRLVAEVEEVLGGRAPTAEDVPRLRYAERVVKEAMRLYSPAWGLGREAVADCEIGGYHVPQGTQVLAIQWVVHRDSRWFADPEVFRPERWDGDLERRLPRCAYFPFGDGPRICIGNHFALLEVVLILATIAQRYRLALADDAPLELVASITMRPKRGIKMLVQERQDARHRQAAVEALPGLNY
jgi:cytochrome P450